MPFTMKNSKPDVYTFGDGINTENFETNYDTKNVTVVNLPRDIAAAMNFNPNSLEFNLKMPKITSDQKTNHLWKYNEDKILNDIGEYVTSTYHGHYCGDEEGYDDIQTIDLMAAKKLAAPFCQANILKYGSRYGDKDGRNKRDLLKVIHYAMLLLHFDGHYNRQNNGLSEFSR